MTYLSPTNLIDGDVSDLLPRLTQLSLRKIDLLLIHYVLDMTDNPFRRPKHTVENSCVPK